MNTMSDTQTQLLRVIHMKPFMFLKVCGGFISIMMIFAAYINMSSWYSLNNPLNSSSRGVEDLFDMIMAGKGENYKICPHLQSLKYELLNNAEEEVMRLQSLMDKGELACGKQRTGIFIRKNEDRKECATSVPEAKKRLLTYLQELCDTQALHSVKSRKSGFQNNNNNNNNNNNDNNNTNEMVSSSDTHVSIHSSLVEPEPRTYGIIYTGKASHFKNIYQSIYGIRNLIKASHFIEVWINSFDVEPCEAIFYNSFENVHCKVFPTYVSGFLSKFEALLGTTLTDVLFIDSDNLIVRNPDELFQSDVYKRTGAIMWPDQCGEKCRLDLSRFHNFPTTTHLGETAYSTFVLFAGKFAGLEWKNERKFAQEAETGQLVLDLQRHRGLLDIGRKLISDEIFFKHIFNGDKDIFRFMFLLVDQDFHFVPLIPGVSLSKQVRVTPYNALVRHRWEHCFNFFNQLFSSPKQNQNQNHDHDQQSKVVVFRDNLPVDNTRITSASSQVSWSRDCLLHYFEDSSPKEAYHHSVSSRSSYPLFFHQLKIRDALAFGKYGRISSTVEEEPSICAYFPTAVLLSPEGEVLSRDGVISSNTFFDSSIAHLSTNYMFEDHSLDIEGQRLINFAQVLFREVDVIWKINHESIVTFHSRMWLVRLIRWW